MKLNGFYEICLSYRFFPRPKTDDPGIQLCERRLKRRGNGGYCKCSGNVAAHELRWMNTSYFHPAFSEIMKASEVEARASPATCRCRVSPSNLSPGKLPHFTIGSKRILQCTSGGRAKFAKELEEIDTSSNTRANKLSAPIYHAPRRSIITA